MGAATYNLQRANGDTRSLEEWGIKSAERTLVNQALDTVTLGFGRQDLLGGSQFDGGETLVISRSEELAPDNFAVSTWFRGRIIGELRGAYGASEGLSVELGGPWWYLENLIYTQTAKFYPGEGSPVLVSDPANPYVQTLEWPTVPKVTSEIVLNENEARERIDARDTIIGVVAYAIAKGAPIAVGTIDPGIAMPREAIKDATCAELILKSLRFMPNHTAWWDYSVDPPALNIRTRDNRPTLTIDLFDEETEQVELNANHAAVRNGVTINYVRKHQALEGFQLLTLDKEQAGPDPEGIGALIFTIELYGGYTVLLRKADPTASPPVGAIIEYVPPEPAPFGIAGTLYAAWARTPFEGRLSMVREELAAVAWLSQTLRIANGNPAWADAVMDIQQVTETLPGRIEFTIGPPAQLGPDDLVALVRRGSIPPMSPVDDQARDNPVPTVPSPSFPSPDKPIPKPKDPEKPPEPPSTDHSPDAYAVTGHSKLFSGESFEQTRYDCGGAAPPCINPTTEMSLPGTPALTESNLGTVSTVSAAVSLGASRSAGPPAVFGNTFQYVESRYASAHYTRVRFDFSDLNQSNCTSIRLHGTKSVTKSNSPNGSTQVVTDAVLDLSYLIGQVGIVSIEIPGLGEKWYNGLGQFSWGAAAEVSYSSLRLGVVV